MLHRVGAALSRLIKPISLTESAASRLATQQEGQSQQRKQENGFQKAEPPAISQGAEPPPSTPPSPPEAAPVKPGLTTAFLNLLGRLEERRRSIKLWPSARNYAGGSSRKKSALRKGIVLDNKVE